MLCSLSFSVSLGMQDDHRLSTSELEMKYGTSIDKVSAQGFLKELPQAVPLASPELPGAGISVLDVCGCLQ